MTDLKTPFYSINTWYSITINPSDNKQHIDGRTTYLTRLDDVMDDHIKNVKLLHDYGIQIRFSLDLSEPHQNLRVNSSPPRLHFHGRIMFVTVRQYLYFALKWLPKMMEDHLIDIDTIADLKVWDDYSDKYLKYFEDLSFQPDYSKPITNRVLEHMYEEEQKHKLRSLDTSADQTTLIKNFFPQSEG